VSVIEPTTSPIPEPTSLLLFGSGIVALGRKISTRSRARAASGL
jgi:hypothetical protein